MGRENHTVTLGREFVSDIFQHLPESLHIRHHGTGRQLHQGVHDYLVLPALPAYTHQAGLSLLAVVIVPRAELACHQQHLLALVGWNVSGLKFFNVGLDIVVQAVEGRGVKYEHPVIVSAVGFVLRTASHNKHYGREQGCTQPYSFP